MIKATTINRQSGALSHQPEPFAHRIVFFIIGTALIFATLFFADEAQARTTDLQTGSVEALQIGGNVVSTQATGKLALTFGKYTLLPSSTITPEKFYSAQGLAFDTYTKKDGYAIALNVARTHGTITHFKLVNGGIKVVKTVTYTKAQINHANDATVFQYKGQKYLFVAKGGDGNKTATMIKLSEFNKGKAKTYKVNFSKLDVASGSDLRGITYVGKKALKVNGKKMTKEWFVVEAGRRLNLMYLKSLTGSAASFVGVDSQRFTAPKIGSRECTAQGVVYHNGYLYVSYGDEGKGGKKLTGKIERIGLNAMFAGTNPNKAIVFPEKWSKTFTANDMFVTESVFFTALEGKGNLYMTNKGTPKGTGGLGHDDCIYKSKQKY